MKKLRLILIILLIGGTCCAQSPEWLWAKRAGGMADDKGYSVSTDAGGNVVATGEFNTPSITFGTTTLTNSGGPNYPDVFIVKYDGSGNVLWAVSAGGGLADGGSGVCADGAGNVYVTGYFNSSSITFGTITLTNMTGSAEIFVVKYDGSGNAVWAKRTGGTSADFSNSIAIDAGGNVFITGCFISPSIRFAMDTLVNAGAYDVFILKYDSAGNEAWARSPKGILSGTSNDYGLGVTADGNGNVFVTGYFLSNSLKFGVFTLTNAGGGDMFIVKYDGSGTLQWAKSAGGSLGDRGVGVCTDWNGNAIVTGWFNSTLITFGTTHLINAGGWDTFIVKYDGLGSVVWAKRTNGTSDDYGRSVTTDVSGNVYVTGDFHSTTMTFGPCTLSNAGNADIFVAKYDGSGNELWGKSAGGPSDDFGYSVCTDTSGALFIGGKFNSGSVAFGADTLVNVDTSTATPDIFIAALNGTVGIKEVQRGAWFSLSPNPLTSQTTIIFSGEHTLTGSAGMHTIRITDVLGNEVKRQLATGNSALIDMSGFAKGIYLVRVEEAGLTGLPTRVMNRKIVVE